MAGAWPDEIELAVTGIAQRGYGVGRWQGRVVFAAGALPGETVRVRLHDRHASFARGEVVAVLAAAPERVASPCPLEGICGAAGWRWIAYEAQLRFKAAILEEQLRHIGGIEVPVTAVHGMVADASPRGPQGDAGPGWGYRTTAELHVAPGRLGSFAPNSRRVADVPRCCLHHPLINAVLPALRALLDPGSPLRAVTLRCAPASGEVLAILESNRPLHDLARQWMRACPTLVGVVRRNRGHWSTLAGQDHLIQAIGGTRWHVGAGSFFQVNEWQTGRLIERVRALLGEIRGRRLLDLFCGVGTFALPLAQAGAEVTGVEIYAPAVDDARRGAALNGITNVRWHAGPVETVLATLDEPFAGAVLDPPRRGCEPAALAELLRLRPARIVYVACHPATLARDCRLLREGGYVVEQAEVIDLFPQTHHIESIVTLVDPTTDH